MTNLTFRKAFITDLESIVKLLADDVLGGVREEVVLPLAQSYLDAFAEIDEDKNNWLMVVENLDGKIIGTMQLTFISYLGRKGSKRMQIEAVRVASEFRGQKIGQQMMKWAIEKAKENGCKIVQLTTDKKRQDAHRFYENLGFQASHIGMKLMI